METITPTTHTYKLLNGFETNDKQTDAVDKAIDFILNSQDREFLLEGKGGTGKTTVIQVIDTLLKNKRFYNQTTKRDEKFVIYAAAPSHSACDVLRDALGDSIPVFTYASLLGMKLDIYSGKFKVDDNARRENGVPIENCNILLADECSMIDERLQDYIRTFSSNETKIIYMGDFRQLPPIRETKNSNDLSPTFSVKNKAVLTERMRQGEKSPIIPIIDSIGDLIEKNVNGRIPNELRVSSYKDNQGVIFESDPNALLDNYVKDFLQYQQEDSSNVRAIKGITYTNDYRNRVNTALRKRIWGEACINQFNIGELLTAFETYYQTDFIKINNAESFIITDIQDDVVSYSYRVLSQNDNGFNMKVENKSVDIKVKRLNIKGKREDYYDIPVIATESLGLYQMTLQSLFDARAFKEAYQFKELFADLQYGYVITSHKAQGNTYDSVYVFEDDILSLKINYLVKLNSLYVALSRPKRKLTVFSRI